MSFFTAIVLLGRWVSKDRDGSDYVSHLGVGKIEENLVKTVFPLARDVCVSEQPPPPPGAK